MNVEISAIDFWLPTPSGNVQWVLRGAEMHVATGTVHTLIGPNGCGKTTLLRLISGLDEPTAGTIRFTGERHHPQRCAFIFQDPALLPWWTTERNVSTSAELRGEPGPLIRRIRDFYLRRVGLEAFRRFSPRELSGGMRTKASMGRAFAHDADVLLLDEPFAHLDALSRIRMQEDLETHWQLEPRTHIMVTHDVEEAVLLSDRVSVMSPAPGRIVATVTVDVPRPRTQESRTHPGFRSATARVWDALGAQG